MADKDIKNLSHTTGGTPEELEELKQWWNAHGNAVTIVMCIVLAVVFGARWIRGHRENNAARAMAELQQAGDVAALESVIHEDRAAPVTDLARLRLAAMHDSAGEFEQAADAYRAFLDASPDHFLADIAAFGLAHCDEALGRVAEAAEAFRKFHETDHPNSSLAPDARIAEARCLILTGTDEGKREGKAKLDLFLTEYPGTAWAAQADEVIRAKDRLSVPAPAGEIDLSALLQPAEPAPAAPAAEPAPAPTPEAPAPEPAPEAPAAEPAPAPEAPAAEPAPAPEAPAPEPAPEAPAPEPAPEA